MKNLRKNELAPSDMLLKLRFAEKKHGSWMILSREPLASVRPGEIQRWTDRNDLARVNIVMCDVVVALDVIKVHCFGDPRLLVEVAKIGVEIGIIDDTADVALEVAMIHRVEANESAEEPPVHLDDSITEKVPSG